MTTITMGTCGCAINQNTYARTYGCLPHRIHAAIDMLAESATGVNLAALTCHRAGRIAERDAIIDVGRDLTRAMEMTRRALEALSNISQ